MFLASAESLQAPGNRGSNLLRVASYLSSALALSPQKNDDIAHGSAAALKIDMPVGLVNPAVFSSPLQRLEHVFVRSELAY